MALAAGLAALEPPLRFLLNERRVSIGVASTLGHLGVTEEALFGRVAAAGDEAGAKAWFVSAVKMDPARDAVALLRLVDAWARARASTDVHARRRAEEAVTGEPLVLSAQTFNSIVSGFCRARGVRSLPDALVPSKGYLESRLERLEEGLLSD